MTDIPLSAQDKEEIARRIQVYFEDELGQDIGTFEATFLFEFFVKEFGSVIYNQGVFDAQAALSKETDRIGEAILSLEKPTGL